MAGVRVTLRMDALAEVGAKRQTVVWLAAALTLARDLLGATVSAVDLTATPRTATLTFPSATARQRFLGLCAEIVDYPVRGTDGLPGLSLETL